MFNRFTLSQPLLAYLCSDGFYNTPAAAATRQQGDDFESRATYNCVDHNADHAGFIVHPAADALLCSPLSSVSVSLRVHTGPNFNACHRAQTEAHYCFSIN